MNSIHQISIFDHFEDFKKSDQLEHLKKVLDSLSDNTIVQELKMRRGNGRNKFPVDYLWRVFISFFILGHNTMMDHLREIARNTELRWILGGDLCELVPTPSSMSRFQKKLEELGPDLLELFGELREALGTQLPELGEGVAMDSKILESKANRQTDKPRDGRRDVDGTKTAKTYSGMTKEGKYWEKTEYFFGYKVHLIVDVVYELPLYYRVTKASDSDVKIGEEMIKSYIEKGTVSKRTKFASADRGYDSGSFIKYLVNQGITTYVDIRMMWQDEKERLYSREYENLYYKEKGEMICYCPVSGKPRPLIYDGYESSRKCQRRKCPAKAYGLHCKGEDKCKIPKVLRIKVEDDPRRFPPVARESYKFKKMYKTRTAVERVNSRLDSGLGLDMKKVRSLKRQELFVSMGLIVMLTSALVQVRQREKFKDEETFKRKLRSLKTA